MPGVARGEDGLADVDWFDTPSGRDCDVGLRIEGVA
jgi:hypothetical protein